MSEFTTEIADLSAHPYGRRAELRAKAIAREIAAAIKSIGNDATLPVTTKSAQLSEFDGDIAAIQQLQAAIANTPSSPLHGAGASAAGFGDDVDTLTKAAAVSFDLSDIEQMHAAVKNRASFAVRAKGYSTTSGVLQPELAPGVLGPIHEPRLIDKLPSTAIGAPSYEYIRHTSTTGGPGIVAEGAAKPESVAVVDTMTATVVKIATHAAVSWETLRDFDSFRSYWQNELISQIYDVEAAQILSGSGTGGNLTGLLSTSGILTHAVDTANGETSLDALESSIAALRVGSAKATANLFVCNPADWSKIRRSKTAQGQYLVAPDPTSGEASTVWGVPVFTTTAQAAGTGVLLDTTKFGKVLVRDAIQVQTGTSSDDFVRNLQRFVIEERIGLAVERPSAILKVTGL